MTEKWRYRELPALLHSGGRSQSIARRTIPAPIESQDGGCGFAIGIRDRNLEKTEGEQTESIGRHGT
jgi:hypothetical protein